MYRIVGYGAAPTFGSVSNTISASLDSFRDLTDPSILGIDATRIDIVQVGRAQTLREFAERYPSVVPVGQLAVINHLADGSARLQAGALVKRRLLSGPGIAAAMPAVARSRRATAGAAAREENMTRDATSRTLGRLIGGPVRAVDGELGVIKDFYFDDEQWTVRYMVVDVGTWLPGRQVLVPLWALEAAEWNRTRVPTRLTRQQVKDSPAVDTLQPISRREEARSLAYYGYPYYWPGPALWGPVATPAVAWTPTPDAAAGAASGALSTSAEQAADEEHLRSWREVKGYHLRAADGEIGHIDDLVANRETWRIEQLLVDTSNWIGGRTALVPIESVQRISWLDHIVEITLTRDEVVACADQHVG